MSSGRFEPVRASRRFERGRPSCLARWKGRIGGGCWLCGCARDGSRAPEPGGENAACWESGGLRRSDPEGKEEVRLAEARRRGGGQAGSTSPPLSSLRSVPGWIRGGGPALPSGTGAGPVSRPPSPTWDSAAGRTPGRFCRRPGIGGLDRRGVPSLWGCGGAGAGASLGPRLLPWELTARLSGCIAPWGRTPPRIRLRCPAGLQIE